MNRQLYANGGIMTVAPREKFGLGSSLKKFVRKIIPNEISAIAVKAAPFVAPFNPALAAGMAGIGGFDQTGRIGSSLKSAALTYGGGQAARYAGGAGFQGNPFTDGGAFRGGLEGFKGGFSSPFGTETGFGKMLSGTKDVSAITPVSGNEVGGEQYMEAAFGKGDVLGGEMLTTGAENVASSAITNAGSAVSKTATQASDGIFKNYFNVLKSGDMGAIGNATMDMGGKALKAVFTKENAAGNIVLDKTALLAAIVAVPSYMEAKALADEAGLTDEEFNEDLYNSEKAGYMAKYQENLPYESFGITAAKNGGRIGLKDGTDKSMLEKILDSKLAQEGRYGLSEFLFGDPIMFGTPDKFKDGKNDNRGTFKRDPSDYDKLSPEKQAYIEAFLNSDEGQLFLKPGKIKFPTDERMREHNKKITLEDFNEDRNPLELLLGIDYENRANGGRIGYKDGTDDEAFEELDNIRELVHTLMKEEDISESEAYEKVIKKLYAKGGRVNRAFGTPKNETMFEELNVDTIYRPDDKPPVLEETLEEDKMVSLNNSRLTQLMLALEEAEANEDLDMIMQIKFDIDKEMKKYAKGGRVKRMFGSPEKGEGITTIDVDMEMEEEPKNDKMAYSPGDITGAAKTFLFRRLAAQGGSDRTYTMGELNNILKKPDLFPEDIAIFKAILSANGFKGYADGGRIGFEIGGLGALGGAMEKESEYITKKSNTSETDTINRIYEEQGNDGLQAYLERNPDLKDKYVIVESYGGGLSIMENKLHPDFLDTSNIIMLTGDGEGNMIEMKSDKVEEKAKGGIMGMEVPVRKNQGGVSELDYRDTGGFVPIGVKERADDVPAMLSKNEFVFTADAVRNAGDGNINKGAQKMYNMMKNLENGGALA